MRREDSTAVDLAEAPAGAVRTTAEPRTSDDADRVYYDGECGFCHWSVRFLVRHDAQGAFRFAPLQGATCAARPSFAEGAKLPDSLIVETADGRLLLRSTAAVYALRRLGGKWRLLAAGLALIPRPLRDLGYRSFAAVRRRLFKRPAQLCPILPPSLAARFDP